MEFYQQFLAGLNICDRNWRNKMPRFTVWLSEEDHKWLTDSMNSDKAVGPEDRVLDIASDVIDQIVGVPEDPSEE